MPTNNQARGKFEPGSPDPTHGVIYTPEIAVYPGGLYLPNHQFLCASITFGNAHDQAIPALEKSLSLYLYYKHFPERFEARQFIRSEWDYGRHHK